jgi:TonB-dependent SusC/RagA subfamily outer membrane receptor
VNHRGKQMRRTTWELGIAVLVACGRPGSSPADAPAPADSAPTGSGSRGAEHRTGAVTSIVPTEADARVSRIEELLRRVPGLQVHQQPDGNYELRIRGHHTITGSAADADPLLVIDDVVVAQGAIGTTLAGLAPRDVARIDVLKDASATGLYGSRGANGVIIIETKRAPTAARPP